jgi:predicted nuclease of predicted toxin-antitoxin system
VSEARIHILLDENVPSAVGAWLKTVRAYWLVTDVDEAGLAGHSDESILVWAQENGAIVVTFDEDFADQRMLAGRAHCGVVRLRVWPTTVEQSQAALARLLEAVADEDLPGALVIVDNKRIRVRRR